MAKKKEKVTNIIRGRVVSAKTLKSAVVLVVGTKTHPMYNKTFVSSHRFLVHDEIGTREGDLVEMVKVRPISRHKHWQITKVVGRDIEAIVTEELKEDAAEAIAEVMPEKEEEVEETVVSEELSEETVADTKAPVSTKKVRAPRKEKK